jgi:hypothetical protein
MQGFGLTARSPALLDEGETTRQRQIDIILKYLQAQFI